MLSSHFVVLLSWLLPVAAVAAFVKTTTKARLYHNCRNTFFVVAKKGQLEIEVEGHLFIVIVASRSGMRLMVKVAFPRKSASGLMVVPMSSLYCKCQAV